MSVRPGSKSKSMPRDWFNWTAPPITVQVRKYYRNLTIIVTTDHHVAMFFTVAAAVVVFFFGSLIIQCIFKKKEQIRIMLLPV